MSYKEMLQEVQGLYPDCNVVDIERALLLLPPKDGRYGKLALEVPTPFWSPNDDRRTMIGKLLTELQGSTRALPDVGGQILTITRLRRLLSGTEWAGVKLAGFMRFGMIVGVDRLTEGHYNGDTALKILPPQYATDVQVILRTRVNYDLEKIVAALQQEAEYDYREFSCSYGRVEGYNQIFWTMKIRGKLIDIRNRMIEYWRFVNGTCLDGREERQYINAWLSGVDMR